MACAASYLIFLDEELAAELEAGSRRLPRQSDIKTALRNERKGDGGGGVCPSGFEASVSVRLEY